MSQWQLKRWQRELVLTFFSCGSLTVSPRLLRELRIWEAATDVDVFSKAWNEGSFCQQMLFDGSLAICDQSGGDDFEVFSVEPTTDGIHAGW